MFKKKPFLIVFEWVEGCGKSFQSKKLVSNLKKKKIYPILTREPGGTKSAELIRNLLVKGKINKWSGLSEVLLNFAARNDHLEKVIIPNLIDKKCVISDRFTDSTIAYQFYGKKVELSFIKNILKNNNYDFNSYGQIIRKGGPRKTNFYYLHEGLVATVEDGLIEEGTDKIKKTH